MRFVSATKEFAMAGAGVIGGAVANGCGLSQTAPSTIIAGGEENVREKGNDVNIRVWWVLISDRKSCATCFGGAISKDETQLRRVCHA
jgi:hypothetical protein